MADAIFDGADFLARSLDWAGQIVAGSLTVTRPEVDRGEAWDEALARGRSFVDGKVFGASPGPYRALELMAAARTSDRVEAFAAEDELSRFDHESRTASEPIRVRSCPEACAETRRAPDPTLARPVTKVGIVGAGLMASQLAILFLRRLQVPVVISDLDRERVDKGLENVAAEILRLLEKRRIITDEANRLRALISGTTDLADFADCDFVEAVFEDMSIKKQVFADLEKHVFDSCVLATNTSSLSVAQMAVDLDHPERVGFHFFNPVAVLPLVEIVRGPATDEETLSTAFDVARNLKKNAVLVNDAAGFVVNRLLLRLMAEIFATVDEGTPRSPMPRCVRSAPMPPYVLLQLVGRRWPYT